MTKYIWQNSKYPDFTFNKEEILSLLSEVKLKQGYLLGKMQCFGFDGNKKAAFNILVQDVIKTSEIEGIKLNTEQVRSSVAKKLGLNIGEDLYIDRNIQGIVDVTLDAAGKYYEKLTEERLFSWQSSMFPSGRSGLYKIKTGEYRNDANGPMQVISGFVGNEKIHYEAPPAKNIKEQMKKLIDYVNNEDSTDYIIKAGIVHLWFVIIHPFEDGNGRIARALSDMLLARSEKSENRFYSVSNQIKKVRKSYYEALNITKKDSVDITSWLKWFLDNLMAAIEDAESVLGDVIKKARFWEKNKTVSMNERQTKVVNRLLDDFEGKLTTIKWAKMCNCSQDSATRDILDLIKKGILLKFGEARATHYVLNL